MTMDVENWIS